MLKLNLSNSLKPIDNSTYYRVKVTEELKNIVSNPVNIKRLIFFDEYGTETTLQDRTDNNGDATLSGAASTLSPTIKGYAKTLNFTSSAFWELADANDLSFGDGVTDSPFSLVAFINPNSVTSGRLISKVDFTTGNVNAEYDLFFSGGNLIVFALRKFDDSAYIGRYFGTPLNADVGSWHSYIGTYDGSKTATGIKIYIDANRVDNNSTVSGTYTGMSNTTAKVANYNISTAGAKEVFGNYKGAVIAMIAEELTQTQITNMNKLFRTYVGL